MAWVLLFYSIFLFQGLFVYASPVAKRDSDFDVFLDLFRNFMNQAPVSTPAGTTLINQLLKTPIQSYTITQNSKSSLLRSVNLGLVRTNFQYGPSVGGGPFYPSGLLGLAKAALDVVDFYSEFTPELALTGIDAEKATVDSGKVR